jgi:hypothetical protein
MGQCLIDIRTARDGNECHEATPAAFSRGSFCATHTLRRGSGVCGREQRVIAAFAIEPSPVTEWFAQWM